ncbi:MAG: glycosyltransferase family 2 protein [Methanobrevibacter sp.]|uniref:glycosyltransferase family 2 protein n=1 Tax=Methanobrevibacter sp. TaxID=66852 RepID=UPI0026DF0FB7|nr:glycosyltransferase family 2 protein [Methanobrevibacter sp.]MDO5848645.1 glycosyltransferase family 2 protein [Methanobrevibacter sp.]
MKVSVVTPNFNGEKFLKDYFDSLNLNSKYIGEVIMVDNGSSDNSVEFIKKYPKDFDFKLIENKENLGFAKATNQAIEASKYPYVFSLNNDVKLESDTIEELLKLIKTDERIFSLSSKMIQMDYPNLIDDAGDSYTLLAYTQKIGDNKPSSEFNEVCEVFSSCAGAALYRKSILDEIGLFDENFFAYMEDVDLSYRAKINGYRNVYCPKAIVYHKGSGTSGSRYNEFKIRLAARNNVWVVYKNLPIPQKILNIGFLILGFLIKYLFFKRKGYGDIYLKGLREGLDNKEKINKVKFKSKNIKNYFKIEGQLIKNTFKLLK